ncbi:MAG: EamA family transporter [Polyangiaceae bacterium]
MGGLGNGWTYALLSAVFAAATAVLAKTGVKDVPSNLATAIRTAVVLIFAWGLVLATGEVRELSKVTTRSWTFLALSGVATGLSWIAYFKALSLAPASRIAPIDKLSLPITIVLAAVVLREPVTPKMGAGIALIVGGTFLTMR